MLPRWLASATAGTSHPSGYDAAQAGGLRKPRVHCIELGNDV